MKRILFIGLGTMGYHMAAHLSNNPDISLSVYNRTTKTAARWSKQFNKEYLTELHASMQFDIVILCLGKDKDVYQMVMGDSTHSGISAYLQPHCTIIDHTTTSYELATKLHQELSKKNISFIDAPLSGGEKGAIDGVLSIMAGGDATLITKVSPILDYYSKSITHIGDVGYGQLAKMVNQICITGVLTGLTEGLLFAEKHKLDIPTLLKAISGGAAGSWQMNNRLETMHNREFDFGFMLKWMIKDLSYALHQAHSQNLQLESTEKIYNSYLKLQSEGHETKDTSALVLDVENSKNSKNP